jgi:amidophosphoribosyltransferase
VKAIVALNEENINMRAVWRSNSSDKLREECGVLGVFLDDSERDAALFVYYGLLSLQHRGQESAGIAAIKDKVIVNHKDMGLVSEVFKPEVIEQLKGPAAIGHVRYSTSGGSVLQNAQPFSSQCKSDLIDETHYIAVAHNGTLTNTEAIRDMLQEGGAGFASSSDSEVITQLIARNYKKKGLDRAINDTIQLLSGSYALVVLTDEALVGARDPNGIRPLCLGQLKSGWILASESCAIDAVGGKFVRDIEPGEIVIIMKGRVITHTLREKTRRAVCSFEYIYFARPDSVIDRLSVYDARVRAGEIQGEESRVEGADLVIGVPDSGIPAAIGYGHATNTAFGLGIVKSKYVGRTFIAPSQRQREEYVLVKHNVIASEVRGKSVVIIDDSIVRGTTSKRLATILRAAGAREVHMRICSPPVRYPCFFGIDTPHRKDLISNGSNPERLCKYLGTDSLKFISVKGLLKSLGTTEEKSDGYCLGCFTGEYPIPVPGPDKIKSDVQIHTV